MNCNIKRDIEKIKDYVGANSDNSPADILFNILQIDTIGVDNTWFFECIYKKNKLLEEKANLFLESLNSNICPFSLVHGYSKNGKSTFIDYVRYLNNQKKDVNARINIIKFNFERGSEKDFIDKIRFLWIDELCAPKANKTCVEEFTEFYNFYNEFVEDLKKYISNKDGIITEKSSKLTSYFENFCEIEFNEMYKFIKDKNDLEEELSSTNKEYKKSLKIFLENVINNSNCGELFSLLILYKIFQNRYKLFYNTTKHQKLLFILDNMDDYLKDNDLLFLQYPQIQISTFIYHFTRRPIISSVFSKTLKKYIKASEEKIAKWTFSFKGSLNITYVFRTANFLAFSNIINEAKKRIGQSREKYYPECMLDINFYKIITINFTDDIIKQRLDFAEAVFNELRLEIPRGFWFLKILTSIDGYKDQNNINRSIFSLWNGDKKALIDYIINNRVYIQKVYFPFENLLLKSINKPFKNSIYLLKGFYLYFFLFLFSNNSSANNFLKTIYIYRKSYKKSKSIRRFLLNYIINNNESIKNKPTTINDIEEGGVGLYELLKTINDFIKQVNNKAKEEIYNFNNIESFFNDICSNKIDYFAQFFTIYKSQIIDSNGDKVNTIYYNLSKELENFKNTKNDKEIYALNQIRVFNNHNSAFLAKYFISHFELYSFSLSHDKMIKNLSIEKPLLLSANKKDKAKQVRNIVDFEFYEIVERVFENAKQIVDTIVDFYVNYLIKYYPPHKFLNNKLLTLIDKDRNIGDFQFRLIIRRHISYLEGFRFGINTNSITMTEFSKDEIKIANGYLINKILDYIKLYFDNYKKIKTITDDMLIKDSTILDKDKNILEQYKKNAQKALKENEDYNFTQIIEF